MADRDQRARLRVAVDATPLLGVPTGIGVFCAGALAALGLRPGLDVRAFAVSWRRRHGIGEHVPGGVTVCQRAMPARPLHALWRHANQPPLEWFIGETDVVHGMNFVVPPARRAAEVVSVHDLTPVRHPELCNPATLAYPGLISRALARGAWVHTDSKYVADEVVDVFNADPARVRVVHPGVPDLPLVGEDEATEIRRSLLPPGVERYCLAIGTAEPRKDLPGLVRAFGEVAVRTPGLALVLAGPPGWGEDDLSAAIAASPVHRHIVRTGWVPPRELAALLSGATVLAYPSVYEGFGFPPLQAMRAGIPVVASGAGSLPEVLGGGALLVEPGSQQELVEALVACVEDEAVRGRLASAGRQRATQFTWEGCGSGLERLYRDARSASGG